MGRLVSFQGENLILLLPSDQPISWISKNKKRTTNYKHKFNISLIRGLKLGHILVIDFVVTVRGTSIYAHVHKDFMSTIN